MRGDVRSDELKAAEGGEDAAVSVEKQQELLLINKLASHGKLPPKSQSNFLQKKLQQRKFFDSGDYAMNSAKDKKQHPPAGVPTNPPVITTPSDPQQEHNSTSPQPQKPGSPNLPNQEASSGGGGGGEESGASSLHPSILLATITSSGLSVDAGDFDDEGQLQIPRPDTVPQRKASILHPSVHSKLSPQPLIHHDYHDESITAPPE